MGWRGRKCSSVRGDAAQKLLVFACVHEWERGVA